jgi:hypothetical protein
VVLVVGLRLGCLNHALLTAEAIRARGLTLAGWVANHIDPDMLAQDDNIAFCKTVAGASAGHRALAGWAWTRAASPSTFPPNGNEHHLVFLLARRISGARGRTGPRPPAPAAPRGRA